MKELSVPPIYTLPYECRAFLQTLSDALGGEKSGGEAFLMVVCDSDRVMRWVGSNPRLN